VLGDLRQLDRAARQYVMRGGFDYKLVTLPVTQPVIKATHPVSAGESALIPETIAFSDDDLSLYRKPSEREHEQHLRDENLNRIRDKARRFSSDPFALSLLAQAEYAAGNFPASEAAADRLLAMSPTHPRGLIMKSLSLSRAAGALSGAGRAAQAQQARQIALKANRADPDDALALLAYYQSFHLAGEVPPASAVDALASAAGTLPADTRIRQLMVDELAAERKWARAIAMLQPLANNPLASPRRAVAREQMAKLEAELAREQGTAPPAPPAPAKG
jgi:tetratricopeptide (TPR) repeat protein